MDWVSITTAQAVAGIFVLLATAASSYFVTKFRLSKSQRVSIFEPDGESINPKFYDYFEESLDSAKDEILVTGEGFGYSSKQSIEHAGRYNAAIERALSRGVQVTRVQTGHPLNRQWAEKLVAFQRVYPKNFNLWMLDNSSTQDIASVCVIDPSRKTCITEMMLSADRDLGNMKTRLASTGLFIHGRRELAMAMKDNINAMKTAEIAHLAESQSDIDKYIDTQREQPSE